MTHSPESADDIDRRINELFGDAPRRRLRRWGAAATGLVVAAVVAALIASSAAAGSADGSYHTATAQVRDVDAQLSSVATIEPVSRAAVTFPTSGTVATLDVAVGETVVVGQQLATLDGTALARTLNQNREALAEAELTLSQALAGELVSDSAASPSATPMSSSTTAGSTSSSTAEWASSSTGQVVLAAATQAPTSTASDPELSALQQAVLDAQRAAEAAIADSNAAVTAARSVCVDIGADDGSGETSSTTVDACLTAIENVQHSQDATAAALQQLATASDALDAYLDERAADLGADTTGSVRSEEGATPSGDATESTDGSPSSDGRSVGGGTATGGGSTTSTATAAQLVAYQKAVSAAELQVLVAEQAIAQATIIAPIAGTVTSLGFEPGDEVTASSTTQTIVVEGVDGVEVVTTVSLTDIASVVVGQPATVIPDGRSEPLEGEVVAVAVVPDDSQSTTAFRVTISLTDPAANIGSGTTGSVTIETADARQVLAVPSSAVSWRDDQAVVRALDGAATEERRVEIGVIGSDWVEITDGLTEGETVVIADLSQGLPGSTEATATDQTSLPDRVGPTGGAFGPPGG